MIDIRPSQLWDFFHRNRQRELEIKAIRELEANLANKNGFWARILDRFCR